MKGMEGTKRITPLEPHHSLFPVPHSRSSPQRMFCATKSQLTRFQNDSTYFGRALR